MFRVNVVVTAKRTNQEFTYRRLRVSDIASANVTRHTMRPCQKFQSEKTTQDQRNLRGVQMTLRKFPSAECRIQRLARIKGRAKAMPEESVSASWWAIHAGSAVADIPRRTARWEAETFFSCRPS